jgi:predicted permease
MFTLIFNQLMKMLIIMAVAFVCYRIGLINQEGNKNFSNLLLMIINPCLIITVYQTDYDPVLVRGLLIAFAAAVVSHVIAILISMVLIREKDNAECAVERFSTVYSNCGFIGIPLISNVLGNDGVFYLTAYMTVFNILSWTHGLGLMKGHFSIRYLKEGLRSPMILCTVTGMILFFLKLRIPGVLLDSMTYIADMNTPVAMMVAGFSVAQADLKKLVSHLRIYWICFLKLLLVPLCILLFLWIARVPSDIAYVTLIAAACPTATTTTMMSIRYNRNYTYASEIFALTTVLSLVTIPLVTLAADYLIR